MADPLAVMAAHVRRVALQTGQDAQAGATLLRARAHLGPGWDRWVIEDVGLPVERAEQLVMAAERAGASVESLRPRELSAAG